MMQHQVIIVKDLQSELTEYLSSLTYNKLFVLTDVNTKENCLPLLQDVPAVKEATLITVNAGDTYKELEQLAFIWKTLSDKGASRDSLLINLGGGMITDMGGFAGATFKRGIRTINIPTTLMASVDAAVGGKTGINFNGLKNEIGSFYPPLCVFIDSAFLQTLDRDNILSGYAEMIKHALISSESLLTQILLFDLNCPLSVVHCPLSEMVAQSVAVKEEIVRQDPNEKGIRKALNLGHTVGHAFESLSFQKNQPLLHGHAVIAGIVCELYLSYKLCGFPMERLRQTVNYIKAYYPAFFYDCKDYESLYAFMTHDKKNEAGIINFTLLANVGDVR
ncbi:3-dehydroquinate synthase, partial [Parabacteroides sp. OttesenSCG-928-K15]|nr:3-dehydroquinate synthase [Parabacteroides sp. OttesenSCG-928-K15]